MRVLLSGGGTAGHIYPALTVAERLSEDGHEVAFIGTDRGPEARLVPEAGLTFHTLPARGFDRSRPLSLLLALAIAFLSTLRALTMVRRFRADVVVGFGGYVSLPVGLAAALLRVPLVLHEQNSVPGMANRALSRFATAVATTYPASAQRMRPGTRVVQTGNPVRRAILEADRQQGRRSLAVPEDARMVLVFGGSRGARHLNEASVDMAAELVARQDVYVLHIAGETEVESVRSRLAGSKDVVPADRYRVVAYVDEMGGALAAADVVIARAGATSIAEITAVGRAAILVPYPYATEDHQTLNAKDVADAGGGVLVPDDALDDGALLPPLVRLLDTIEERDHMAALSGRLGLRDATQRLCALIEQVADLRSGSEVSV